ncbi:ABC transporter permease [Clostridium vincentii]|uniref:ABC-2 family transporter protein n=1 Tax=Clostridium vincentii TaxID=52704 RepID=A0A2T0BDE6_9CLOT|nr:ABC transporter permease [Clostridium vincentii]PRR81837.1 ABC-2 family transporter protein [Clostridium vincentii]
MRLIQLTIIQMKQYLKNPMILIMGFIFPTLILLGIFGFEHGSDEKIGVINNDNSEISISLIDKLSEEYNVKEYKGTLEDNMGPIKDNEVGAMYVINEDFSQLLQERKIPKISCYKKEEQAGSIKAESIIDTFVKGDLEEKTEVGLSNSYIETVIEKEEESDKEKFLASLLMICYFMLLDSSFIIDNILKLKAAKVLRRSIVTPNSDRQILGGIFVASFLIQWILSSLAFIIVNAVISFKNVNIPLSFLIIMLCSLICTSIVIVATRWLKNPAIAGFAVIMLAIVSIGLAMIGSNLMDISNAPEILTKVTLISPFYWLMQIAGGDQILVGIVVLILASAVLFTAGTFKLRDFVKE